MRLRNIYFYLIIGSLFLFSCEEEKNENDTDAKDELITISLSEGQDGLVSGELKAVDTLFEGYNKLFIQLKEVSSGALIEDADLKLIPMMHMVGMKHSAPVEHPGTLANEEGLFVGAVVFIMPSNPDEGWKLNVAVKMNDVVDTIRFNIPKVKSLDEPKLLRLVSPVDESKYFVSMLEPSSPAVGMNTIEFTVHTKQNMMMFPAAEDITISFEPEMPSMDHGSPNNEAPFHTGTGHYVGKVNFTMTGWWRINVQLSKGNDTIANDLYFDISF